MIIGSDIEYIGVNDHIIDLFEGLFKVPQGMSYNSYLIPDEKIAVMDTVDVRYTEQWLDNLESRLKGRQPDYLIVQHMEPDHSAGILEFSKKYPEAVIVATAKAFDIMKHLIGRVYEERRCIVEEGDVLSLGRHRLLFVMAPMVHWPEVMVTYDQTDKILFSADAFGRFGALDRECEWGDEARRYYFGIVGKFGVYVRRLLAKVSQLEIRRICPLHGPVLEQDVSKALTLYHAWSGYEPEEKGTVIAYASVYGNTEKAALILRDQLRLRGEKMVETYDLTRCDQAQAVAAAFRYDKLVLAAVTYNGKVFPPMREFLTSLVERNFCNRRVALMENGSWAPAAAKGMHEALEKCKGIQFAEHEIRMMSVPEEEVLVRLEELAAELCEERRVK